jgi:DNA-binding HxlR family transcriptional regulator
MESRPLGNKAPLEQPAAPTRCPLTAALNAVGGKWSMVCLYWLSLGPRRFNELQRLMPEISHKVLTETLRNLEQESLITRVDCAAPLPHTQYRVSPHGESAVPLIEAVRQWGHEHMAWRKK